MSDFSVDIKINQNGGTLARCVTTSIRIENGIMIFHDQTQGRVREINIQGADGIEVEITEHIHAFTGKYLG